MSFIDIFNKNYIKTGKLSDIILFNDLQKTCNVNRKQLIFELKKNNINYSPFFKLCGNIGCITGYNKIYDYSSIGTNKTPDIIEIQQNIQSNLIYPKNNIKNKLSHEDIIKFSPVMISKYRYKLQRYKILNNQKENSDLKIKIQKYTDLLAEEVKIKKSEKIIDNRLIPITCIVLKFYGKLYNDYENELNNVNFENIKNDELLSGYYIKYLNLKNQPYKTDDNKQYLIKLEEYINDNYENAINNKMVFEQKTIINKINLNDISSLQLNNPTLELLVKFIQYNDVCSDFYFDINYGKKSLKIYKMLLQILIHFHDYSKLLNLYEKNNVEKDINYDKLIKYAKRI